MKTSLKHNSADELHSYYEIELMFKVFHFYLVKPFVNPAELLQALQFRHAAGTSFLHVPTTKWNPCKLQQKPDARKTLMLQKLE